MRSEPLEPRLGSQESAKNAPENLCGQFSDAATMLCKYVQMVTTVKEV